MAPAALFYHGGTQRVGSQRGTEAFEGQEVRLRGRAFEAKVLGLFGEPEAHGASQRLAASPHPPEAGEWGVGGYGR